MEECEFICWIGLRHDKVVGRKWVTRKNTTTRNTLVEVFWVATLDMHNLVEKMGVGESPTNEWCGNNWSIMFSAIVSYGSIQGVTEFAMTTIQRGRTLTRSLGELLQFEAYKRQKSVSVKQDCNHHVGPSLQAGNIETLNDYMDSPPAFEGGNVVYYVANSQKVVVGAHNSSLQVISFCLSNQLS